MARMPARGAAGRPRPAPDHARLILARVSDLAGRGADARRMRVAVEDALAAWAAEAGHDAVRERLDEMREQLAEGIEAAREQLDELEGAERGRAARVIEVLGTARAALVPPVPLRAAA